MRCVGAVPDVPVLTEKLPSRGEPAESRAHPIPPGQAQEGFPPEADLTPNISAKGAAATLKKRMLTNLGNVCPQWLVNAHKALDEAVAAAYGWPADLSGDEIVARLLDLNLARAAKQE